MSDPLDVTGLIGRAREGDKQAESALFDLVYEQLRRLAQRRLQHSHSQQTLGVTDLVNEAYLELSRRFPDAPEQMPESRRTFYKSIGDAMRTILRDYARRKAALKRGGGARRVAGATDLPDLSLAHMDADFLLDFDVALDGLEAAHPNWYETVVHRYLAGRTVEETAQLMGLSPAAIKKYWRLARAWLSAELSDPDS